MKSQKVIFSKSQKLLTENLHKRPFNSYSFNFNGGLCNRRIGFYPCRAPWPGDEHFLWFLKSDLLRFHPQFTPFWLNQTFVFEMYLVTSTIANMCPNVIHFDAMDFSACRSEKVMFLSFDVQCYSISQVMPIS